MSHMTQPKFVEQFAKKSMWKFHTDLTKTGKNAKFRYNFLSTAKRYQVGLVM